MIQLKEAIDKIKVLKPDHKVIGLSETEDIFIVLLDTDDEGYETVNKKTGELGFLWFWEYGQLSIEGKIRDLDDALLEKAS